jgi:hypothetical protein
MVVSKLTYRGKHRPDVEQGSPQIPFESFTQFVLKNLVFEFDQN